MMDSGAVDEGNSSSSSSSKVSRRYTPLSFYMDSAVEYPALILKGNKSESESKKNCIPLSFYNTTLVYYPAQSKMDIFLPNQQNLRRNNHHHHHHHYPHSLSFYFTMDPTVSRPDKFRINYIPLSSTAVSNSNSSSQSKSESKVIKSSESKVSRKNYIPDQLTFSILSKLPVKSLKRFECVCKSWSILFENTYFMKMYSKHFISRHGSDDYHTFLLTQHYDDDGLYRFEFHLLKNRFKLNVPLPSPFQPSENRISILGCTSVNGVFCLAREEYRNMHKFQYVLWNPLTEEFMEVPRSPAELSPKHSAEDMFEDMYLEYLFHGFGYDQLRDDFKLIQFIQFQDDGYTPPCDYYSLPTCFFEIYSLKSNSWRMFHMDKDLCRLRHDYSSSRPFEGLEVYVDGVCHWLVSRSFKDNTDYISNNLYARTLLSFDLSDEVFLTTPIGEEPYSPYTTNQRLTVLNGSIALISNYHDDIVFHISILGELGVSESWIKLYIYGPLPSIQWPPIGFGKMGYLFITKKAFEVAYVDLSTQIIEEVGITGKNTGYVIVICGLYKESLLSIGGSSN